MMFTAFIYLFNTALVIYTFFGFGQSTLRNVFYSLSKIFNSWWWIRKVCLFENENEFYFLTLLFSAKCFEKINILRCLRWLWQTKKVWQQKKHVLPELLWLIRCAELCVPQAESRFSLCFIFSLHSPRCCCRWRVVIVSQWPVCCRSQQRNDPWVTNITSSTKQPLCKFIFYHQLFYILLTTICCMGHDSRRVKMSICFWNLINS